MDKSRLLDRLNAGGDERLVLARVLDKLDQAERKNIPVFTDFLSPQEQAQSADLLRLAGRETERYCFFGGFAGAERKMLALLPDWLEGAAAEFPLRCLRASFRPEDGLTHRDILGSLMAQGIVREKVGDLLVGADSCDLIVSESMAAFLLQNWDSAGRAHLQVAAVEAENIHIPAARREEVRDTVAALRLDAVASTGFRLSRGKAAELIQSGRVQVNWRDCVKPDRLLAQGDTVSARGFGKFVLTQVGGVTRKGRTSIVLERYL